MAKLKGVGFDLDGTLVDSIGISVQLVAQAAAEVEGRPFSREEIVNQFGQPEARALAALCPAQPEQAFATYQRLVKANLSHYKLFPEIGGVLQELAAKVPLSVYTTRGRWATDQILDHLKLRQYFKKIVAGEDVRRLKPDPEGVSMLAEAMKFRPEEMLYCGDSPGDLAAARAAGSPALQVLWGAETVVVEGYPSVKTVAEFRDRLFASIHM